MKRTFVITIVDLIEESHYSTSVKEENLDKAICNKLGGWQNITSASTSNDKLEKGNYQQAGTTKDGKKLYSILCY